jgi:DNA-binding transcriptional ArsR family regulator
MTEPRIVDASRPALRLEVAVAEAAELLMSLAVIVGDKRPEDFDLGAERIAEIRAAIAPDLLSLASEITAGSAAPALLLGAVYETPAPRTVADFLAHLEASDPLDLQLSLLGYHTRGHHVARPETIRRAAEGDAAAAEELIASLGEWQTKCRFVERALEIGGDRLKSQLLQLLDRWNSEVFEPTLADLRPLLERDAEEKQALAARLAPGEFVERATAGIEYVARPEIHVLVFFPTYWFRPWVMITEHKNARIFAYGIGNGAGAQSTPADLSELARLYKALGDEKRLALLRLLHRGPVALGAAAREVGLSKSTTHHHLAILRQAGFVLIRDDEENSYSLRPDRRLEVGRFLEQT